MIRKQDFKQLVETDSIKEANKFLEEGFVLVAENKSLQGGFNFLLGLPKKKED